MKAPNIDAINNNKVYTNENSVPDLLGREALVDIMVKRGAGCWN